MRPPSACQRRPIRLSWRTPHGEKANASIRSGHMSSEIELVSDGDGLAIIGNSTDIERFFLSDESPRSPGRRCTRPD